MPKSTRKIVTGTKATAKPVAAATPAKPVAVTPAPVAAKPVPAVAPAAPAVAKPSANITRTAATVVKQATNFAVLSDRDTAYLAFYGKLSKRNAAGTVTLADIVQSGEKPNYAGSNKPHDAGVIVRLTKAGLLSPNTDGHGFVITASGKTHRAFSGAVATPAVAPKA